MRCMLLRRRAQAQALSHPAGEVACGASCRHCTGMALGHARTGVEEASWRRGSPPFVPAAVHVIHQQCLPACATTRCYCAAQHSTARRQPPQTPRAPRPPLPPSPGALHRADCGDCPACNFNFICDDNEMPLVGPGAGAGGLGGGGGLSVIALAWAWRACAWAVVAHHSAAQRIIMTCHCTAGQTAFGV